MGRLYIYLHEWLVFMVNVGKDTSPMDPMGWGFIFQIVFTFLLERRHQDCFLKEFHTVIRGASGLGVFKKRNPWMPPLLG